MTFDPRFPDAVNELVAWVDAGLRLQRVDGTVFHQLLDDFRLGRMIIPETYLPGFDFDAHNRRLLNHDFQVFVVQHDWAQAFANSDLSFDESSSRPPYDHCCFEFLISGKRVCYLKNMEGNLIAESAFVRLSSGDWLQPPLGQPRGKPLRELLQSQYFAIAIALDAAVAETDVVRAPHKLNRAREKRGKPPIFDYRVVALAHRSRTATLPSQHIDRTSPRLHFRRGHWRHFDNFKTWINWMLVGDPDLGFIEKHYRL